jgi:hypothetical protein
MGQPAQIRAEALGLERAHSDPIGAMENWQRDRDVSVEASG